MLVANSPLFIEDLSGSNSEVQRGSWLKRRIVVRNLGDRTAEVDVWIVATNKQSEPLLRWCTFSEPNPIRLNPQESREVTLNFEIPPQAAADVYTYEVLVDARAQYPDKPPIRRPQQFRVLPSNQDAEWGSEPSFSLQPVTNSNHPHLLQVGEQLEVQVTVKNCSRRVDRFYLTCPELAKDWFTVQYPENNLETTGLVRETDGLELNPDATGIILLKLHPPRFTPAGNYFPTLRLTSSNKEERVLLDVVYLQVLPDDRLEVQFCPQMRKIPTEPGLFAIELANQGNTARTITLHAGAQSQPFIYHLIPNSVHLLPGRKEQIHLTATSKHWWRRPLWGKGWELPVELEIQTENANPVPQSNQSVTIPQNLQGTILWEPRPWWFLLLLLLAGLGAVGTVAFLLWWMLFKPQPIATPKIVQFANATNTITQQKRNYHEGDNTIYLDWQISHLKNVDRVTIVRLEQGREGERKSYSFAGTIPNQFRRNRTDAYCETVKMQNTDGLRCQSIPIPIREAGEYTFKLQVFTKQNQNQPVDSLTADTISVESAAVPQILELTSSQPAYQAGNTRPDNPIRLNWEISNASNIKELKLIGLASDSSVSSRLQRYSMTGNTLPPALSPFCVLGTSLVCRNVPTTARQPGDYTFRLAIVPREGQKAEIEKATPVIKIQAPPLKILSFQINGQEVKQKPKFVYELNSDRLPTNVVLSWRVEKGDRVRVELLPAPGLVPLQGTIDYPLSKAPNRETLTLKVTNHLGEQVSQTFVLETIEPRRLPPPQSATPHSSGVAQPSPTDVSTPQEQLQPGELPPKPVYQELPTIVNPVQ